MAEFFQEHHMRLVRHLNALTRSKTRAEDLAQEVWVRLLIWGERGGAEVLTWSLLARIGTNLFVDGYREKKPVLLGDLVALSEDGEQRDGSEVMDRAEAARFREAMALERIRDSYEQILHEFGQADAPAHYLTAFAYNRPLAWKLVAIVSELSGSPLRVLGTRLEAEFEESFRLNPDQTKAVFGRLRKRLLGPSGLKPLPEATAGETTMANHFRALDSAGRAKEVGHWSYDVYRKVVGGTSRKRGGRRTARHA